MVSNKTDPRAATAVDRHIGARIRSRRLEIDMSQETLAAEIGVTFQQIQKYEKGVNRVSAAALHRIAQALKLQLPAFLPRAGRDTDADATSLDDQELIELAQLLSRLNGEGRELLFDFARMLAKRQGLTRKR